MYIIHAIQLLISIIDILFQWFQLMADNALIGWSYRNWPNIEWQCDIFSNRNRQVHNQLFLPWYVRVLTWTGTKIHAYKKATRLLRFIYKLPSANQTQTLSDSNKCNTLNRTKDPKTENKRSDCEGDSLEWVGFLLMIVLKMFNVNMSVWNHSQSEISTMKIQVPPIWNVKFLTPIRGKNASLSQCC